MSDTPVSGGMIHTQAPTAERPPIEAALNDVHSSIDRLEGIANTLDDKLSPVFADESPSPAANEPPAFPMRGSSATYHRTAHASSRLNELQVFLTKMLERIEL